MNGQVKAAIPALIGITVLLLAGLSGIDLPRTRQAEAVAETRAVTLDDYRRQSLATAFRADAEHAARDMGAIVAADLAVELKAKPSVSVAHNTRALNERG